MTSPKSPAEEALMTRKPVTERDVETPEPEGEGAAGAEPV